MSILSRFLQKRNLKEEELRPEEKAQFDQWKLTLSEGECSVEKIKEFCIRMVQAIEVKWADFDYPNKDKLIPSHSVYKAILGVIDGPKAEKERLEKYLTQLIENG
jgi:hypothetical protein